MKKPSNVVAEFPRPEASVLTLGSVRAQLVANGFDPCSAVQPDGRWISGNAPYFEELCDWQASEHTAAVRLRSRRPLVLLIVRPIEDAEVASRVHALLDKHGLRAGPCRRGSDETAVYVLRGNYIEPLSREALDGCVRFLSSDSAVLPLDGAWSTTLLETAYEKLPAITRELIDEIPVAANRMPWLIAEERRPPPKPSIDAWINT